MSKKLTQLGQDPSTAAHKLRTDILFDLVVRAGHKCFRCGGELDRASFSIEHKEAWLDSDDPVGKFFDLQNIAFSHRSCNISAARRVKIYRSEEEVKQLKAKKWAERVQKIPYDSEKRRQRYLKYGS